jgi:ribonuclease T1
MRVTATVIREDERVRRPAWTLLVLVAAVLALLVLQKVDTDDGRNQAPRPLPTSQSGLPAEVQETLDLVDRGGPFPYRRDGVVFMNREGRLPAHESGYWHEYTVPTPGSDDRGARRLVVGRAGEAYYTADHYRTFRKIRGPRGGS